MVSRTLKKILTILESSDIWSQKWQKTEMCGNSVRQRIREDRVYWQWIGIDLCRQQRQTGMQNTGAE